MARSKKITELPVLAQASSNDLLIIEDVSTGNTKSITISNLLGNSSIDISANTITTISLSISNSNTPSNSTISVAKGTLLFDNNYIYVAIADNNIKRAPLESF